MSYIHVTKTPGVSLDDYQRLRQHLGPEPIAGQRAHLVGEAAGALHIVDVWESKAVADRFATERLFPAFEQAGLRPGPDTTIIAFDADE